MVRTCLECGTTNCWFMMGTTEEFESRKRQRPVVIRCACGLSVCTNHLQLHLDEDHVGGIKR